MQNSGRTRRTRTKQTGSSIPVRISSNEQTRKKVKSAHSDDHGSSVEHSSSGNSNNVETSTTVYSSRSDESVSRGSSSMGNANNVNTEKMICTSRSDASDGEITTVRQTFRIVGTIDNDNRCSIESLDSNKDSAFHGSQDLLGQEDNDSDYSEVKMIKSVSFEDVGSNDDKLWLTPREDIKVELQEEVGKDEELLREELLRIFDRERFTLGNFFKNKMDDLSRDYRKRELDLEEHSRAEIAEIEHEVAEEKSEMQKVFANEIAALTRTFNEDRASMEQFHKQQIKELREQFENDQKEREQKFALEKNELQEKLESDFQAMLRAEIAETKQSTLQELEGREEIFNIEKLDMERRHSVQLTEAEMNTKKVKDELEMMFSQEKARLEEDLVEKIKELEHQLMQEREMRIKLEALLQEEKTNVTNLDSAKRTETETLKSELENLRLELDDKNRVAMEMRKFEEEIKINGKNGLNGKLREDFDRIIEEHKQELERKYLMDKEELQKYKERQLQEERTKNPDHVDYERKKMKEEIEKERKDSISTMNGNWEATSEDYSLRKIYTGRNEYSASISYGNQEQQRTNQYKGYDQLREGNHERKEYGDKATPGYSSPYNQPKDSTTHPSQFWDPNRENLICFETSILEKMSESQPQYEDPTLAGESISRHPMQDVQQEPRGSQYNSYNREDGECPNSFRHVQQPEQSKPQYDSFGLRQNDEAGRQPHSSDPEYISSHHSKDRKVPSDEPKSDLYYVTPGNENSLRTEINDLRRENEGLKAKIEAMEENIDLHKKYKAEAKEELTRLQKAKDTLQSKINDKSEGQEDAKRTKGEVDKLEKSLKESEEQRKKFEAKVRELNDKLSDAEEKAQQAKNKANDLENKIRGHSGIKADKSGVSSKTSPYSGRYSRDPQGEEIPTYNSSSLYKDPSKSDRYAPDTGIYPKSTHDKHIETKRSDRYGNEPDTYRTDTKYTGSKREDPKTSERFGKHVSYPSDTKYSDSKHENIYGYPAELSQSFDVLDYKKPRDGGTIACHLTNEEPQLSWKNTESKSGKCSGKSFSKSQSTKRPEISSLSSPIPIYGSHVRLGKSSDKQVDTYKPGRYSSFGGVNEPGFNTSSPRKLEERGYDNQRVSAPNDDSLTKKEKYERAVAERDKLVQLIKELKDKVEELYVEKERIDNEQSKLRKDPIRYNVGTDASDNQADLKSQVEEMQRKIRALAERLKRDTPKKHSFEDNDTYRIKPSAQDIEDLQHKLQRTGDAINHTNVNLDPDALRRIEHEIKTIGDLIKSHFSEENQGCSTYRSEDTARVLQLQKDKQELEVKLSMAKDVMNDYVNRLSEKMENLEGANALSDATLQELYERNAKLKETLKALEKGQKRSEMQNEQLMHEKSALQNVIGRICKSEDTSYCSQYSTPRESENCYSGNYGYCTTSQGQCKVPELEFSDRFCCY